MVAYPVRVTVKEYNGQDAKKLARYRRRLVIADRIEDYLNEKMKPLDSGAFSEFDYGVIASDLKLEKRIVRDILYALDCGSNGITIGKPNASGGGTRMARG